MKLILPLLSLLFLLTTSLPYTDQIALANSLNFGRTKDQWQCKVCDKSNRPSKFHFVHQLSQDVKGIISLYPQFALLAFRYTNSLRNVWQDILYPFQVVDENTCDKCKVQKVYNKMWNSIRYNISVELMKIRNQTKLTKLIITGISLGGGLAAISFIDIYNDEIFPSIEVMSFGAPKVGNKHWTQFFDNRTGGNSKRYMIKGDPIVLLPECFTPLCNYKHVGKKLVCHSDTKTCHLEKELDGKDPKWQTEDVDEDISNMGSIIDHIAGYPKIYNYTLEMNENVRYKPIKKPYMSLEETTVNQAEKTATAKTDTVQIKS